MSTRALRPWTDLVKLHPDVEAGVLTEAIFAIDLGAITAGDPNVPVVNRDPEAFVRVMYLTAGLQKLMEEVLASLDERAGYNRVLKLRTPFGGGKSHIRVASPRRPAVVTFAPLTHSHCSSPQPRPSHQSSQGSPLCISPSAPA